jgi:hypothetical protein
MPTVTTPDPQGAGVWWESVVPQVLAHPGLIALAILSVCVVGVVVVIRVTQPGSRLRLRTKDTETLFERLPPLDLREAPPDEEDRKVS